MLYCDAITDAMTKGLGQQKACVRYNIFTSLLDVVFLYFLLPTHGMDGYFVSFFVTHLINFMLSIRRLMKITVKHIPMHIPAFAIGGLLFGTWACSHLANPIIRCVAYALLLAAVLCIGNVVSPADLRWLKGIILQKSQAAK